jgi:hypothetical protein
VTTKPVKPEAKKEVKPAKPAKEKAVKVPKALKAKRLNREKFFRFNNRNYCVDFYIKKIRFCIEFFGTLWHANPKYYKVFDKPFKIKSLSHLTAGDVWKADKERFELFKNNNLEIMVVWEDVFSVKHLVSLWHFKN